MDIDFGSGRVFRGAPLEIVRQMKASAEGAEELDLGAYIDWVVERAATVEGVILRVERGPLHERARSLLTELVAARFARDMGDAVADDRSSIARWRVTLDIVALERT